MERDRPLQRRCCLVQASVLVEGSGNLEWLRWASAQLEGPRGRDGGAGAVEALNAAQKTLLLRREAFGWKDPPLGGYVSDLLPQRVFFYKVTVTIPDICTAAHKVTKYDHAYYLIKRPCGPVQKVLTSLISRTSGGHSGHLAAQVTWHPGSPRFCCLPAKGTHKRGGPWGKPSPVIQWRERETGSGEI